MWEGLPDGCRAGLALERCSQLAVFAIQSVGWDAAAVWLAENGVPRCAPLPSSTLVPLGRCSGTREAGSAESLVALYRVDTHQIRRRRGAARSSSSQGKAEPLCARIKGANREVSEGKSDIWPRSVFFLQGPTRSGERARCVGLFQGCTGLWTAECWLARRLHQLKNLHHHGPR